MSSESDERSVILYNTLKQDWERYNSDLGEENLEGLYNNPWFAIPKLHQVEKSFRALRKRWQEKSHISPLRPDVSNDLWDAVIDNANTIASYEEGDEKDEHTRKAIEYQQLATTSPKSRPVKYAFATALTVAAVENDVLRNWNDGQGVSSAEISWLAWECSKHVTDQKLVWEKLSNQQINTIMKTRWDRWYGYKGTDEGDLKGSVNDFFDERFIMTFTQHAFKALRLKDNTSIPADRDRDQQDFGKLWEEITDSDNDTSIHICRSKYLTSLAGTIPACEDLIHAIAIGATVAAVEEGLLSLNDDDDVDEDDEGDDYKEQIEKEKVRMSVERFARMSWERSLFLAQCGNS